MRGVSTLLTGVLVGSLLTAGLLTTTPGTAAAEVRTGLGHEVPAQPYRGNPDTTDWLGSYLWHGKQVWCVQFAYKAPDSDEPYRSGDVLRTKWGTPLSEDVAAQISYLLLRYSDTSSADEAAALAHLLHSWTAAPREPGDLDPSRDFRQIAYDVEGHFAALPESAQQAVERLRADAEANHGPWTVELRPPDEPQQIGTPGTWELVVAGASGQGIGDVPVTLEVTDGTLDGEAATGQLHTPADGSPLVFEVTPTGPEPRVEVTLAAPATQPRVEVPEDENTQRIVTTGGEEMLTEAVSTTAVPPPGEVVLSKVDAESGAPVPDAAFRITGADRTEPAVRQDGTPLLDQDGQPAVLRTGDDGTLRVEDLRAPQEICLVEVDPAPGYEDDFDPDRPPAVCGTVQPGETLTLSLANAPNPPPTPTVPSVIPAGLAAPRAVAPTETRIAPTGLIGLGALTVLSAGLLALAVRRRDRSPRPGRR